MRFFSSIDDAMLFAPVYADLPIACGNPRSEDFG